MKQEKKEKAKKVPDDFLIHSPEEEFRSYTEQQLEQLKQLGENDKVELYREALEVGMKSLQNLRAKIVPETSV